MEIVEKFKKQLNSPFSGGILQKFSSLEKCNDLLKLSLLPSPLRVIRLFVALRYAVLSSRYSISLRI